MSLWEKLQTGDGTGITELYQLSYYTVIGLLLDEGYKEDVLNDKFKRAINFLCDRIAGESFNEEPDLVLYLTVLVRHLVHDDFTLSD